MLTSIIVFSFAKVKRKNSVLLIQIVVRQNKWKTNDDIVLLARLYLLFQEKKLVSTNPRHKYGGIEFAEVGVR